jgi:hypothetical protein
MRAHRGSRADPADAGEPENAVQRGSSKAGAKLAMAPPVPGHVARAAAALPVRAYTDSRSAA